MRAALCARYHPRRPPLSPVPRTQPARAGRALPTASEHHVAAVPIRDRDSTFTPAFDAAFAAADIHIIRTWHAHRERPRSLSARSALRCECLNHILITGPRHLAAAAGTSSATTPGSTGSGPQRHLVRHRIPVVALDLPGHCISFGDVTSFVDVISDVTSWRRTAHPTHRRVDGKAATTSGPRSFALLVDLVQWADDERVRRPRPPGPAGIVQSG
jgi:hypothetical protein